MMSDRYKIEYIAGAGTYGVLDTEQTPGRWVTLAELCEAMNAFGHLRAAAWDAMDAIYDGDYEALPHDLLTGDRKAAVDRLLASLRVYGPVEA